MACCGVERGFRVELGEIENQFLKDKSIRDVIVVARDDAEGNKYAVAYFVAYEKKTIKELKTLSKYEIPKGIYCIKNFVKTPTGKINRTATLKLLEK